jgi:tellurite resistance protein
MKKSKPEIFTKIINVIQEMSSKVNMNPEEMNAKLKIHIKEIIKHDDELSKITEEALELTGEQLIARLDLEHLKINRTPNQMIDEYDEEVSKQKNQKTMKKEPPKQSY